MGVEKKGDGGRRKTLLSRNLVTEYDQPDFIPVSKQGSEASHLQIIEGI